MKTYPSSLRRPSLNLSSRLQKTWHCALPIAALLMAANAHATAYYWDSDGNMANGATPGSGTWNLTSTNWWSNTSTPDFIWPNVGAHSACFSGAAGTYTVNIGESGVTCGNFSLGSSGYTFNATSAQTLNIGYISFAANNVTATIGSNLRVQATGNTNIGSGAFTSNVLNIYGTLTVSNTASYDIGILGASKDYAPTVNLEAGAQMIARRVYLGAAGNGYGVLNVNGGLVDANSGVFLMLGSPGSAGNETVTLSSGTISAGGSGLAFANEATVTGTGVFNLNGGILSVNKVTTFDSYTGILNFNGGTLKATAASTTFMTTTGANNRAKVLEGGAVIDTQTYAITVARALESGTTSDGGLTKKGTGNLTLSAANTYNGATTIKSGTLTLAATGSIDTSSTIVVGDAGSTGTVLDVSAKSGFTIGSSQTLKGIGTVKGATTVAGTLAPGNSIGTISTGNLTLGSTSVFDVELGRDGTGPISDRTNVVGTVGIISGADLTLTLYTGLSKPLVDDIFYLINNDGSGDFITGEFTKLNGVATTLSEGSNFDWNNQQWVITYKADAGVSFTGGNDVAIMAVVPEPSTWAMIVGGVGMLAFGNRIRRRMPR